MKIIEALKQIKMIDTKLQKIAKDIGNNSARLDNQTSPYADPVKQVASWVQSARDLIRDKEMLTHRVHVTNVNTTLSIEIGGRTITKTLDQWLTRRRHGIQSTQTILSQLTDRGLKEVAEKNAAGEINVVKIVRHYIAEERDKELAILLEEPYLIDSALEIANATVELVE